MGGAGEVGAGEGRGARVSDVLQTSSIHVYDHFDLYLTL